MQAEETRANATAAAAAILSGSISVFDALKRDWFRAGLPLVYNAGFRLHNGRLPAALQLLAVLARASVYESVNISWAQARLAPRVAGLVRKVDLAKVRRLARSRLGDRGAALLAVLARANVYESVNISWAQARLAPRVAGL